MESRCPHPLSVLVDKGLTEISSVVILLGPGNSPDISRNLPEYMLGSKLNSNSIWIADSVGVYIPIIYQDSLLMVGWPCLISGVLTLAHMVSEVGCSKLLKTNTGNGKGQFSMGNTFPNGCFSIVMFVFGGVCWITWIDQITIVLDCVDWLNHLLGWLKHLIDWIFWALNFWFLLLSGLVHLVHASTDSEVFTIFIHLDFPTPLVEDEACMVHGIRVQTSLVHVGDHQKGWYENSRSQ